ncbi:MAG TPA: hypothetical protein VHX20_04785 [Terracidiphilus sp.]|jgi:hypothetical protein|nr:hypothetical protein [Terracidiphilus sp.]
MNYGARFCSAALAASLAAFLAGVLPAYAAPRKPPTVVLGAAKTVPYSKAGDPAGDAGGEATLRIRALLVNGVLKEWTTGDPHDVTDRSFVVRRAIRLNDSLPGDKRLEWVWQRGPWLLADHATGRVTALKLPDYDPAVSQVEWFRDYGAYCGLTPSGKSLYAVVAQLAARRPVLSKKLAPWDVENHPSPACAPAEWQRDPMRVTFHPAGQDAVSFDVVPGSAVLVEDTGDDAAAPDSTTAAPDSTIAAPGK